ncbi:RES family NAD+ phosphorylase, partial [Tannerella forsythia]|uniref:RES family NAD+ phosphorylase n=1 Tax=Tannerella forsythia TaxID=28112 RepID=UPI0028E9310A
SKDIKHDNKIHIEYVPTQIMTEYFRYVFTEISDIKIDGILYPSSQNGGNCYVLFFDNKTSLEFWDLKV